MELSVLVPHNGGLRPDLGVKSQDVVRLLKANEPSIDHVRITFCFSKLLTVSESDEAFFQDVGEAIASPDLTELKSLQFNFSGSRDKDEKIDKICMRFFEVMSANRSIENLRINYANPNDISEFIPRMGLFFEKNEELKSIDLNLVRGASEADIESLFTVLKSRKGPIEKIGLTRIGYSGIEQLLTLFNNNSGVTPKRIFMSWNWAEEGRGCLDVSRLLSNEDIDLEEVNLTDEMIDQIGFQRIANALASRKEPLNRLVLKRNQGIGENRGIGGSMGIIEFAQAFASHPDLIPNDLCISGNDIGPVGLQDLSNVLVRRSSPLESLELYANKICTETAKAFLAPFHQHPGLIPKILNLNYNLIDDLDISPLLRQENCALSSIQVYPNEIRCATAIAIARSLATNKTVREILFDIREFPQEGWWALGDALCNETNISATFTSNHTLTRFGCENDYNNSNLPHSTFICWHLTINVLPDKELVARMKIVDTHFARKFDLNPFKKLATSLTAEILGVLSRAFAELEDHGKLPLVQVDGKCKRKQEGVSRNNNLTICFLMVKSIPEMLHGVVDHRKGNNNI